MRLFCKRKLPTFWFAVAALVGHARQRGRGDARAVSGGSTRLDWRLKRVCNQALGGEQMRFLISAVLLLWTLTIVQTSLAAQAAPGFETIDAGACKIFTLAGRQNVPNITRAWSGVCKDGYARGQGILRTYDSGELVGIGQYDMRKGRSRPIESYQLPIDGSGLVRFTEGAPTPINPSGVPSWAREITASGLSRAERERRGFAPGKGRRGNATSVASTNTNED